MSWLDALQRRGEEARGEAQRPNVVRPARKPRPVVQSAWMQIRPQSSDSDPGEVAPVYFTVDEGVLMLTDEKGKPLPDAKPLAVRSEDNPKTVATRAARDLRSQNDPNNFSRPLGYSCRGVA